MQTVIEKPIVSAKSIGESKGHRRSFVRSRRRSPTSPPIQPSMSLRWKRTFDVVVSLLVLVIAGPIILLAVVLVKLTSRGPGIYSQVRLGLHGKPFRIYKIRTMHQDAEATSGVCWSKPGDPRITPLGRFLRRTHVDELPQLWNVLVGEMSLVGPRPERPEFVPQLEQALPHYRERLRALPGITGLAQVQLPPDVDLESVHRKLACDVYYVSGLSFWLDLRILITTGFKFLGLSCRWPCRVLRIPGTQLAESSYQTLMANDSLPGQRGSALVVCPQTV